MIQLKVNGVIRNFDGDPEMPLLWYLRDVLGLTGTKFGCGIALCGACTVHKNGEALRACITPMSSLAGAEIRPAAIQGSGNVFLLPFGARSELLRKHRCGGRSQVRCCRQAGEPVRPRSQQVSVRLATC